MTNLKKTTAIALITLMSTAPLAAFATETGSPAQSVKNDPDEYVAKKPVTTDSVVADTASGTPAKSVMEDADEDVAANDATGGTIADELPTSSPVLNDG